MIFLLLFVNFASNKRKKGYEKRVFEKYRYC